MEKHYLVGLSLSQCLKDWINGIINLESIHSIIAGTAIAHERDSIMNWITTEPAIYSMKRFKTESITIDSIYNCIDFLFFYRKLIQPRLIQSGLRPAYFATEHWIHYSRLTDWYKYNLINQSCPYCGMMNDYHVKSAKPFGTGIKSIELDCHECHQIWLMPFDTTWHSYESTDWQSRKSN